MSLGWKFKMKTIDVDEFFKRIDKSEELYSTLNVTDTSSDKVDE